MKKIVCRWGVDATNCFSTATYLQYLAEADFAQSESVLWHLRVAEGDHLSERSEGRKLPQHRTRALARPRTLKTLLRGCFGGDARGAEKGA